MSQRVLVPGNQIAEFPDGMSAKDIEAAVRGYLGLKESPPTPKAPDLPEGVVANLPGALKETFGAGARPGAVPLTGTPETKTPLGVVLKPEGALERATSAAVQAPLTAAAGGPVGRIAVSTALSAAEQAAKGKDPLGWGTIVDAMVTAGTEAAAGILGRALKPVGKQARAFDWATTSLAPALDYVKSRLKTVRMVIPSIDPAKKITWDEAIEALKKMTGEDYRVARAEIANWMNQADKQVLRPRAGQVFKDMTSKKRFPASRVSEAAEQTRKTLKEPAVRAAADVATREKVTGDVPAGLVAWETLKSGAERALTKVPGVGPFVDAAKRMGTNLP